MGAGFGAVSLSTCSRGSAISASGWGLIALILLCVELKLQFAAAGVLVFIRLSLRRTKPFYGANRLLDTSIGTATALVVNIALKPYNNRARITEQFTHFLQSVPAYVEARVICGRYPDLSPLSRQLGRIAEELSIFEKQNVFRLPDHRTQAVYLRGCEQLANALLQELTALCAMDEKGRLSPENAESCPRSACMCRIRCPRRRKATRMWWAITTCPACCRPATT